MLEKTVIKIVSSIRSFTNYIIKLNDSRGTRFFHVNIDDLGKTCVLHAFTHRETDVIYTKLKSHMHAVYSLNS